MRKFSFLLLSLCLSVGAAVAQDAGKLVKTGSKALAKYVADASNTEALQEARSAAKQATEADASLGNAWLLHANTYAAEVNAAAANILKANTEYELAKATNPGAPAPDMTAVEVPDEQVQTAFASYKKAYEKSEKSSAKKKAIDGMTTLSQSLSNIGNAMLGAKRYDATYVPLKTMVDINDYYIANGEEPLFSDAEALNQQKYIMAVVARQAGNNDDAGKYYKELYEAEYDEAAVYAGYSAMLIESGDETQGLAVMAKGREKYPENTDILFAEINYYIQKEDYTTLETKLQEAITAEPDNVGLYNALGNVYMNLSQEAEGDVSNGYMEKSINYFTEAVKRDPKNVDATYSIGSLYYNKAVAKTQEMNSLGTTKADQKRYDELNGEITVLFDQALPYFEKAVEMDPDDRNTLIALKEIYARKNEFDKSKQYKARLDALDGK